MSDQSQVSPFTNMMVSTFTNLMRDMMFCLPAEVKSFDQTSQLATVQCSIKKIDGKAGVSIPPIENVLVHFAGNEDHHVFHKVENGTTGFVVFSQRSIEEWTDRGGEQVPADARMLEGSDAFFICGVRPRPKAILNFKNEGIGISNRLGTYFIHLDGGEITAQCEDATINALGTVEVNATDIEAVAIGDLTADVGGNAEVIAVGDVSVTALGNAEITAAGEAIITAPTIKLVGNVETTGTLMNNGVNVGSTHTHGGVMAGGSVTSTPL